MTTTISLVASGIAVALVPITVAPYHRHRRLPRLAVAPVSTKIVEVCGKRS
jgi:hypothetical protein